LAALGADDPDARGLNPAPSYFKGDELPVEQVSWCDATRFANALSRLDGRAPVYVIFDGCAVSRAKDANGYRLPTEAEWEFAARAGTATAYWSGDTEADLARVGCYDGNAIGRTHAVAEKPENAWGLHDVHGNVWEWCEDHYDSGAYSSRASGLTVDPRQLTVTVSKTGVPTSAESAKRGALRVVRGGSWISRPENARSAYRVWYSPSYSYWDFGFRLMLSSP
jgi:sulfatase modifying factor 1